MACSTTPPKPLVRVRVQRLRQRVPSHVGGRPRGRQGAPTRLLFEGQHRRAEDVYPGGKDHELLHTRVAGTDL